MEFVCFVWISEQTANFALHNIKIMVFITEVESVYCAVRAESLYNTDTFRPEKVNVLFYKFGLTVLSHGLLEAPVGGFAKVSLKKLYLNWFLSIIHTRFIVSKISLS